MALFNPPLPSFPAVSREFAPFPFEEPAGKGEEPEKCACWEGIWGRMRSSEELKEWENQPERRVGRSLIFKLGAL